MILQNNVVKHPSAKKEEIVKEKPKQSIHIGHRIFCGIMSGVLVTVVISLLLYGAGAFFIAGVNTGMQALSWFSSTVTLTIFSGFMGGMTSHLVIRGKLYQRTYHFLLNRGTRKPLNDYFSKKKGDS